MGGYAQLLEAARGHMPRIDRGGCYETLDGLFGTPQRFEDHPQVVEAIGGLRIELDRFLEVASGFFEVAAAQQHRSPVVLDLGIPGRESGGTLEFEEGGVEIASKGELVGPLLAGGART